MMECSEKLFEVTDCLEIEEEPASRDGICMPITEYKASIEDELSKGESNINSDENNHNKGTINEKSKFPKQNFIILKNIRLEDLQQNSQQGQFLNIAEVRSNLTENTVGPCCVKGLISREALEPHLKVCKQLTNYLCDKCPFLTWNNSLLKHHYDSIHVEKECPNCALLCENKKSFISHYKHCKSRTDTYLCEKCAYTCKELAMLKFHVKLMHSDDAKSIRLEKSIIPPKKAADLTDHGRLQKITNNINKQKIITLVTAKSLYSKNYDSVTEPNNIANSLPLKDQSNSVEQDNIINSLASQSQNEIIGDNVVNSLSSQDPNNDTTRDNIVNSLFSKDHKKDYSGVREMIAETIKQQNNHHDNNTKTIARVTKICRVCNITTEFDVDNRCKTCNVESIFRCNQCSKHFKNYRAVSHHLWTQCNLKGHYYCLKCNFKSPFKFEVRNHCDKYHPEICDPLGTVDKAECIEFRAFQNNTQESEIPALNCRLCDVHFNDSVAHSIVCHKMEHAVEKIKHNIDASGNLSIDILEMENTDVLRCIVQYCVKCDKDIILKSHRLPFTNLCNACNNSMFFKCIKCGKLYRNYDCACQHSKRVCLSQESLKCNKCDYTTYHIFKLSQHYQQVHDDFSGTCQHCEKRVMNSFNYKMHLMRCIAPLAFSCEDCPFKTKSKLNLRNHILSYHLNVPSVNVDSLKKTYKDPFRGLRSYLKSYCTNCCKRSSVAFRVKKCRKCKKLLHFGCQMCQKTFKGDNAEACKHIKTYLTLLKFECHCCGKGFSTKDKLDTHMTSCRNTLPLYTCRFCTYTSIIKIDMQNHERQVHPIEKLNERYPHKSKIYQCTDCSIEYVDKIDNLRGHILRCHVKGNNKSKLPPCERCNWNFKSCIGLRKHLALCGKKLYMQCRVDLTRVKVEPVNLSEDIPVTIKEEQVDLKEFEVKFEE